MISYDIIGYTSLSITSNYVAAMAIAPIGVMYGMKNVGRKYKLYLM